MQQLRDPEDKAVRPSGGHSVANLFRRSWYRAFGQPASPPDVPPFIAASLSNTSRPELLTLRETQSAKLSRTRFCRIGREARYRIERLDTRTKLRFHFQLRPPCYRRAHPSASERASEWAKCTRVSIRACRARRLNPFSRCRGDPELYGSQSMLLYLVLERNNGYKIAKWSFSNITLIFKTLLYYEFR